MARLCLLVALLFILCVPVPTHALTPIVQCGFPIPCTACDFFQLSANLMRWLVALVTLVITLVVVYSGVLIITSQGNAAQLEKAKSMLKNAFIGFIILLAAWLIIDTVMKLSKFGAGSELGPWNAIATNACTAPQGSYVPTPGGAGATSTSPTPTPNTGDRCDPSIADRVIAIPSNLVSGAAEKALPETVENFRRMHEAAKADGVTLLVTDGYRHPDEQWTLRQQYGCTNPNSSQCPGGKQVAISCHEGGQGSNHQTGNALDINVGCGNGNGNCSTKAYKWLKTNGSQFGFYNNIPTDPVHWSPTGR